ncbi:MAG: amidohydrolase family protein [Gammaproteobacteria bacterium]
MNRKRDYLRIATEEAWAPAEMLQMWRKVLQDKSFDDPGFHSLWGFFLQSNVGYTNEIVERLVDLDERRIHDMDSSGIDKQLLLLTAPGVQVFDADTANSVAAASNDRIAEVCRNKPDRFAALAAVAPQDPTSAAGELERAVNKLGLKGAVINSHTRGEYLDDPKFWEIFEAAEALDVPIYIHPQTPPRDMIQPFLKRHLDGAIMGFAVEVALHTTSIILSGAFDRFPNLKIVIGHAGEGLPFWLYRLDHMQDVVLGNMGENRLQKKISDYIRENIYVTSSGMCWEPAVTFIQSVLGMDRVLYAMDYPYQFVPEEVEAMDALPLGNEDLKKFYQRNAESVFSL